MQITGIESISLEEVNFPFPPGGGFEEAQAIADVETPVLPGEQEVTSTVHISYFIGSSSNGDSNHNDELEDEN